MNKLMGGAAFAIGLAVVCWVGAGYIGSSPLAVAVIAAIVAVYLAGAFELWRFDRATGALQRELRAAPEDRVQLDAWLQRLPPALRNPVRLRIDGERVGLPGPVLAPYLVGLLVLLGMLGTFLGMVLTLHGAVAALETSTDLQAIRAALAAPVKGLGFAFGTSVAGVAASAMLGLVLALSRRARLRAAQLLDTQIAGSMRALSFSHRRDRVFDALASQAAALPELVSRLEAMSAQIEQQGEQTSERLLSGQQRFHDDARRGYSELAASVDASLKDSLAESARLAGEAIRPAVAETMNAVAAQTGELQSRLATIVERQLDGVSGRFDTSVSAVTQAWAAALASHERSSEKLGLQLQDTLAGWAENFERRSASLLDGIAERSAETQLGVARHAGELHDRLAERGAALLAAIGESVSALQAETASADRARQARLAEALESMAAALRSEWEQLTARSLAGQQQAFQTLGDSVRDIAESTQTQAVDTVSEVARLIESAAAAPRAAAEVVEQLRKELSASIARDNEQLAERARILEALGTLTASATQAAAGQRQAIEGLANASATLLERAGERFAENVDAQSARIVEAAGQVSMGAVEVAALGEAFGHAVRLFGETSDRLMTTLARIEGALEKSSARSDEQLGYYVAQARELIDLSVASQRQVVEDLARLARNEAPPATELSLADEA
ncbi:MAG TPA: DUF802 domain-containing protein [Burkholderiaceae bacterium]|nr:DUF802 domain-containing protein [Burkholderiaceae bacterium]